MCAKERPDWMASLTLEKCANTDWKNSIIYLLCFLTREQDIVYGRADTLYTSIEIESPIASIIVQDVVHRIPCD